MNDSERYAKVRLEPILGRFRSIDRPGEPLDYMTSKSISPIDGSRPRR
jgi:hypothetical protein